MRVVNLADRFRCRDCDQISAACLVWAMVLPQQRKRREMFPNTALNSISPAVRMLQAFPNIFFLKKLT